MNIEAAVYDLLINDAAVEVLVGRSVYPAIIPQGESLPAITYQQISGVREYTADGAFGMTSARFQINCWAESYSEVRNLADAVRIRLDGLSGTAQNIKIYSILIDDETDMSETIPGVEVLERWGKRLDFIIWYEE